MAFRVPVPDVSVVDLTVRLKNGVCVLHMCRVNCNEGKH